MEANRLRMQSSLDERLSKRRNLKLQQKQIAYQVNTTPTPLTAPLVPLSPLVPQHIRYSIAPDYFITVYYTEYNDNRMKWTRMKENSMRNKEKRMNRQ